MAIKMPTPNNPLIIGGNNIQWVDQYKYLGIIVDKNLYFEKQITYLRERAKARLAPMQFMTSTQEGAKFNIQKLYYTATVRSLVDYSAPVLVNLKESQQARLEVIQNNALRLMLGAPMWTRLCNLQHESNFATLKIRIGIRNLHIAAKTLISDRKSIYKTNLREDLNKHQEARKINTYVFFIGNLVRDFNMIEILKNIKEDTIDINYKPKPWELNKITYNYTNLAVRKNLNTSESLKTSALQAIQKVQRLNTYNIYTDGSVDPTTETAGSAVFSNNYTASWRISNTASTMQSELIAIRQALLYTIEHEHQHIAIHTDSKSAIQALQIRNIKENKKLITQIHALIKQHTQQNKHITLNWIPSHIGIEGNDKADTLAKQTNNINQVQLHIQPTLQQIKNKTNKISKKSLVDNVNFWVGNNSLSAKWYRLTSDLETPIIDRNTPRSLAVIFHRLRLGYKANWQITTNTNRPCNHCNLDTQTPLIHYLLQCHHTATFRNNLNTPPNLDLNSHEAFNTAALLVKNITQNLDTHKHTLLNFPPPR